MDPCKQIDSGPHQLVSEESNVAGQHPSIPLPDDLDLRREQRFATNIELDRKWPKPFRTLPNGPTEIGILADQYAHRFLPLFEEQIYWLRDFRRLFCEAFAIEIGDGSMGIADDAFFSYFEKATAPDWHSIDPNSVGLSSRTNSMKKHLPATDAVSNAWRAILLPQIAALVDYTRHLAATCVAENCGDGGVAASAATERLLEMAEETFRYHKMLTFARTEVLRGLNGS